jgi:putative ABC transport system permease protein
MSLRRAFARLLALPRKRTLELDLEGDIRAHLELAEADARAHGLSAEEAQREARRRFGGIEQMKEVHRDRRGMRWIETVFRDFQYGLVSLGRAPGFTAVVVGVLALGIGGAVAMFGVMDAVLLKPLPFPDPGRIVRIWEAPRPGAVNATTVPQFLAWKRSAAIFDGLAAEQDISSAFQDQGGPVRLEGKLVTPEYFKVFASGVAFGRTFAAAEDQPGVASVIVLSHAAWETYFGSDAGILHRRVILDGETCQVIGVLAPGAFDRDRIQFWKPLVFTAAQKASDTHWLTVYGRLRAGVSLSEARERMQAIYAALLQAEPLEDRGGAIAIERLDRLLVGANLNRSISVAFGAVFLVLLIACANVANLLFAKGAARRTELAVRAALGAGRGRLIAQLLTESLALCLLGGVAGVAVAYLLIRLASPLLSQSLPFTADVALNPDVLAFAAAVVLAVALLAGMFPALQVSAGNLAESLKQSARGSAGSPVRARRAIVMGELALSFVLVCGALLLLRSLLKLQQIDTGVRIENVMTMSIDLPQDAYPTPQKAALFYAALTQRLRSAPGVANVGLSTFLPLQWISNGEAIQVAGAEKLVRVRFKRVNPGYFSTLDIPVLRGRGIISQDREGSPPVVVINQALGARLTEEAGMKDPIGKMVRLSSADYEGKNPVLSDVQIAGIIRSERTSSPGDSDPAVVYVPLAQAPNPHLKLLVRTPEAPASVMPAVREAVRQTDPNLPLGDVSTMQQVRDDTLSFASRPAWLLGAFSLVAVFLAAIGLYGMISHLVTQQWREIGIRMALGARSSDVLSQILRGALAIVVGSVILGLLGVLALTGVMRNLLFEVSPLDPLTLVVACVAMALIGLLAAFLPAHRAARVDPAVTLRDAG